MASDKHKQAIKTVTDFIVKEFGKRIKSIDTDTAYYNIGKCRPDILFKIRNYGILVVEIGYISEPEKVLAYLQDQDITEFRWYTKDPELILSIDKGNSYKWIETVAKTKIGKPWMKRQIEILLREIQYERKEMKQDSAFLADNIYMVCPSCHNRFLVNQGKIIDYDVTGQYKIIICKHCESVPSAQEFDELKAIQKEMKAIRYSA